jgi:hypothetical protein
MITSLSVGSQNSRAGERFRFGVEEPRYLDSDSFSSVWISYGISRALRAEGDWMLIVIVLVPTMASLVVLLVTVFKLDWEQYLEKRLNEKWDRSA